MEIKMVVKCSKKNSWNLFMERNQSMILFFHYFIGSDPVVW